MKTATRVLLFAAVGACHSAVAAGQPAARKEPVPLLRFREGQSAFSTYSGLIDSLRVVVRDSSPGAGCPVAAVVTQPVDLAKLPASARSLRFRERSLVIPCVAP